MPQVWQAHRLRRPATAAAAARAIPSLAPPFDLRHFGVDAHAPACRADSEYTRHAYPNVGKSQSTAMWMKCPTETVREVVLNLPAIVREASTVRRARGCRYFFDIKWALVALNSATDRSSGSPRFTFGEVPARTVSGNPESRRLI